MELCVFLKELPVLLKNYLHFVGTSEKKQIL
jgi:hypothetical protein